MIKEGGCGKYVGVCSKGVQPECLRKEAVENMLECALKVYKLSDEGRMPDNIVWLIGGRFCIAFWCALEMDMQLV